MRVLLLALAALSAAATVSAEEFKAGDLLVMHPVVRATPGGAKVGGGYLTVRKTGSMPDPLVATERPLAARVDIHAASTENGIASIRELADGLPVAVGRRGDAQPGRQS